jgi:hypothetical protein
VKSGLGSLQLIVLLTAGVVIMGGAVIYWFTGASMQAVTTGAYRAVEFIKANIKLDGTAQGGILVAIAGRFKLPVHAVGIGEGIDDLQPFDAGAFSHAIAGLD